MIGDSFYYLGLRFHSNSYTIHEDDSNEKSPG